jgi:hypothetical protein
MAMDHFDLHGDEGQGDKNYVLYILESIIWNNILWWVMIYYEVKKKKDDVMWVIHW